MEALEKRDKLTGCKETYAYLSQDRYMLNNPKGLITQSLNLIWSFGKHDVKNMVSKL